MRLKPAVASGTMRTPSRHVVLGSNKFRIPAGTGLWMPSYVMHNSGLNWGPDADVYRPVS
jgi:cytochrome P450